MGKSNPVTVGDTTFPSQKAAEVHFRSIRDKYADNVRIVDADYAQLMALLALHPDADMKQGVGVDYFTVDRDEHYHTTRCFYIHRHDGSRTDVSFKECISARGDDANIRKALRSAIKDQIFEFRDRELQKPEVRCPFTKEILSHANCHVDHAHPDTLSALIDAWLHSEGIQLTDVAIQPTLDNQFVASMTDQRQIASWQAYHKTHAKLRLLTARGNLSDARKSN